MPLQHFQILLQFLNYQETCLLLIVGNMLIMYIHKYVYTHYYEYTQIQVPTIGLSMLLLLFFSEVSHATICYCVFRDVIEDTVTIKNAESKIMIFLQVGLCSTNIVYLLKHLLRFHRVFTLLLSLPLHLLLSLPLQFHHPHPLPQKLQCQLFDSLQ